jgi:hypothetical protein
MQPQSRGDVEEDAEKNICERSLSLWSCLGVAPGLGGQFDGAELGLGGFEVCRISHTFPQFPTF